MRIRFPTCNHVVLQGGKSAAIVWKDVDIKDVRTPPPPLLLAHVPSPGLFG